MIGSYGIFVIFLHRKYILEGTDFRMDLSSRNPFLQADTQITAATDDCLDDFYVVWMTSKIQVNFRLCRCLRVLMIGSYGFS